MPAQTPALRRFSASSGPKASTCRYGSAPRGRTLLDEMKSTSSHSASPTALWGGIPGAQACRLEVSANEIDERVHVFRLNGVGRHARDSVHAVFSWQMSVSVQPRAAIRPMMSSGKGRASRKAHSAEEAGGISRWRGEQRFCLHLRSAVLAAADLDRAVVVQNTEREGGLSGAGFRPWILAGPQVGSLPLTCANPESVDGTRYGSLQRGPRQEATSYTSAGP